MNILLTGATGFLGARLIHHLLERDEYKIVALKRTYSDITRILSYLNDITLYDIDTSSLEKIFSTHKFDAIIHTATEYGRGNAFANQIIQSNILFPSKLLDLACKYSVKTFINTDTFINTGNSDYNYLNYYSLSKKHFLEWAQLFAREQKIQVLNMNLQHIFGPGDSESKFVTWIIRKIVNNKEDIALTLGEQKRDFIFIDDVVDAYLVVLSKCTQLSYFESYDVGTGHCVTLRSFIEKIVSEANKIKKFDKKLEFGKLPYRDNEFMDIDVDIRPLKNLGWIPKVSLEQAIQEILFYKLECCDRKKNEKSTC